MSLGGTKYEGYDLLPLLEGDFKHGVTERFKHSF